MIKRHIYRNTWKMKRYHSIDEHWIPFQFHYKWALIVFTNHQFYYWSDTDMLKVFLCSFLIAVASGQFNWNRNVISRIHSREDPRCPQSNMNPPVMLDDPTDCTRFLKCEGHMAHSGERIDRVKFNESELIENKRSSSVSTGSTLECGIKRMWLAIVRKFQI